MIEVRQLKHLLAISEHGSFRRAAKAVHLSQPALTKSVQQLERQLGAPLFDRAGRRVEPTPVGREVLARAKVIAAECEALRRVVEGLTGLSCGSLVVGAGPYVASSVLGPALGRLVGRHPGLRVRVEVDHWRALADALEQGGIDLFVADLSEVRPDVGLEVRELPREPIVWFCRPGHPLARRRRRIRQADFLAYPVAGPSLPPWAEAWFHEAGATPLTIQGDHYPMLKQIVLDSDCVSGAPRSVVAHDLECGRLAALDLQAPVLHSHAGIVRRKNRTLPPAAEALIAELLDAPGTAGALRVAPGHS